MLGPHIIRTAGQDDASLLARRHPLELSGWHRAGPSLLHADAAQQAQKAANGSLGGALGWHVVC